MCSHVWREINDIRVCARCGLTIRKLDGKIIFDRDYANAGKKKGRKNK